MDNKDYIIQQLINENAQLKINNYNLTFELSKYKENEVNDSGKEHNATSEQVNSSRQQ